MADDASTGSSRSEESDADRAMREMQPKMAEFIKRFTAGMQARETGYTRFEVKYSRGRVTAISVSSTEESAP